MGISIGVVGAGEFADKFIPLFQAHPEVDEVRLAELVPERCAELAALHGITKTYGSSEELSARPTSTPWRYSLSAGRMGLWRSKL